MSGRMCNNFMQQGQCRFGDTCMYRHGPADVRNLEQLASTKPCLNFQRGECRFSEKCIYSHSGAPGGGGVPRGGRGGGPVTSRGGARGRGAPRGGRGGGGPRFNGPVVTVVPHSLPSDGLKVYLENRVYAKLQHQKVDIFRDLVARGTRGSAWRGFDERLPEVVAFGGTGLRTMIMAVTGVSQDKPNTLYVFFFEPSFDKQETEVKELRALKQQKGAGGMFGAIQTRLKGTTDLEKIVIRKSKDEVLQDEEAEKAVAQKAHEAATSMDALDRQVAAMSIKQQQAAVADDDGEEDEGEENGDFDMDDFL